MDFTIIYYDRNKNNFKAEKNGGNMKLFTAGHNKKIILEDDENIKNCSNSKNFFLYRLKCILIFYFS